MVLLALMQANAAVLDVDANCAAVDAAAGKAAAAGAQLLLTPELFPVGYAPLRLRAEFDPAALPSLRHALADVARRNGIALVYSLPAVTAAGEWQITATLVDKDGDELLSYAKVHLFGPEERQAFAPAGASPGVVDFNGLRTSLVICYDVEFPEAVRAAAVRGAELLAGADSPRERIRRRAAGADQGEGTGEPSDGGLCQPLRDGGGLRLPGRQRLRRPGRRSPGLGGAPGPNCCSPSCRSRARPGTRSHTWMISGRRSTVPGAADRHRTPGPPAPPPSRAVRPCTAGQSRARLGPARD